MYQSKNGIVRFAPLFIHSFRLIAPRKLLEAQQFNRRYHSYEEISSVPYRLRWCRHQQGWMQKEVAERIGITREQYISYEKRPFARMLGIFPRNLQLWEIILLLFDE
jgi:DNA-binding XRE family transcriptional regulator